MLKNLTECRATLEYQGLNKRAKDFNSRCLEIVHFSVMYVC